MEEGWKREEGGMGREGSRRDVQEQGGREEGDMKGKGEGGKKGKGKEGGMRSMEQGEK